MPQINTPTLEDGNNIFISYNGTANTTKQTFTFTQEQNGMTFRNKGNYAIKLTINGEKNTVPAKSTIEIDDKKFSSFDAEAENGTQAFELRAFTSKTGDVKKSDLLDITAQLAQTANFQANDMFNDGIFLWAHRGMVQVAPENTIPAIRTAKKYGFKGVELDVWTTTDDVPIVFHDTTMDRMTDGTGTTSGFTLEQIKSLTIDSGKNIELYPNLKIPTLEEALQVIKEENLYIKFDIRSIDPLKLYELIKKYRLETKSVVTANDSFQFEFRKLDKNIFMTSRNLENALKLGNCFYGIVGTNYTKADVEEVHKLGLRVSTDSCYSLNDFENIKQKNVDMLLTDVFIDGGL